MAFHDVRLSQDIARSFIGGPKFKTTVSTVFSGVEDRNQDWSQSRGEWNISFPLSKTLFEEVRDFFYARRGRVHSFRFKDWADYTIGDSTNDVGQFLVIGDGVAIFQQLFKRYGSPFDFDRTITKPVDGTLRVWFDGVEIFEGAGWVIDYSTGVLVFGPAPGVGVVVTFACEFDAVVRFGVDKLDIQMPVTGLASIATLPIIEMLNE